MNDADRAQPITAAVAYEDLLVPALFAEWAPRVVAAASVETDDRVLDIGCGTGVLAREASSRVGSNGFVAGLDANSGMLSVATRLSPGIEWRQGIAESLPYSDRSFDAVISQFSLMFFKDQRRAVQEMLRVLKSPGRLAVAVWDKLENIPAYAAEVDLLRSTVGHRAAGALSAPFTLGDRSTLNSLFASAGSSSTTITTHHGMGRFPNIRSMVEPDLRGWLPVMGVSLSQEEIGRIMEEAEDFLRPFTTTDGKVEFTCRAHIITATKS